MLSKTLRPNTLVPSIVRHSITLLIIFAGIAFSSNTYANGNYHVEVIIFKQPGSAPGNQTPNLTTLPSFSSTWKSRNIYLNSAAAKIRNSGKYQILTHTAWGQKSASYKQSAAQKINTNGLNGFIKVFAKQLLFTDVKINFEGHTISERRRLKLNEVHYFDNQGLGVLMRVSRS